MSTGISEPMSGWRGWCRVIRHPISAPRNGCPRPPEWRFSRLGADRGRTYLFAGPEQQQQQQQQQPFLADPDRYAPALSGDDPVLAFEQGKSMPGQRRYGVVCQSRMYLFTSPATRTY